MPETLLQKAQRLGIKPAGTPKATNPLASVTTPTSEAPAGETLLQKAQRLGIKPAGTPKLNTDTASTTSGQNPLTPVMKKPSFWEKAGGALKNVAVGVVKPIAQTAIQFPQTVIASAAQLPGDIKSYVTQKPVENTAAQRFGAEVLKPVNVPVLGEVKGLSAAPGDAEKYGTQTAGEDLGQAAEIGATLVGAKGVSGSLAKGATGRVLDSALVGAEQGIKSGALSGFAGGVSKKGATGKDVLKSTIKGAYLGGAVGALGGALSTKLTKSGRAALQAKQAEKEALDVVAPKLTNKVKEEALAEGRVATKGLLKKQIVLPSTEDKAVAKSVEGLVSAKAQPVENINAIKTGIKDVAESHVRPVLETNPRPYNMNTFKARIGELKMPTLFKADPIMENTYKLVQQRAAEIADQYPKTKLGSWQARQAFDQAVEKEFPRVFDGSAQDNVIKHAVNDVRGAWNDFIVEGLPGNNGVKESFKQMSRMYKAADNIAEKGARDVGTNALERVSRNLKEHPYATAGAAAYTAYQAGKNLSGSR